MTDNNGAGLPLPGAAAWFGTPPTDAEIAEEIRTKDAVQAAGEAGYYDPELEDLKERYGSGPTGAGPAPCHILPIFDDEDVPDTPEVRAGLQKLVDAGIDITRLPADQGHDEGCYPDPNHPGWWICTEKGHPKHPDPVAMERDWNAMTERRARESGDENFRQWELRKEARESIVDLHSYTYPERGRNMGHFPRADVPVRGMHTGVDMPSAPQIPRPPRVMSATEVVQAVHRSERYIRDPRFAAGFDELIRQVGQLAREERERQERKELLHRRATASPGDPDWIGL